MCGGSLPGTFNKNAFVSIVAGKTARYNFLE
jgi:hypothetical protein